ncbi:hypothetical protein MferCBS31731_007432 [Microsporum ferrugineum]
MSRSRYLSTSKTESINQWLKGVEIPQYPSKRKCHSHLGANGAKRGRTTKNHTDPSPRGQQLSKPTRRKQHSPPRPANKMESSADKKAKAKASRGPPPRIMPSRKVKRVAKPAIHPDKAISSQASSGIKGNHGDMIADLENDDIFRSGPSGSNIPISGASRKSTPSRAQLVRLHYARPFVRFQPFSTGETPVVVKELFGNFVSSKMAPIPSWMAARLRARYPNEDLSLKINNADEVASAPSPQDEELLIALMGAYKRAHRAYARFEDEGGWSEAIQSILQAVVGQGENNILEVSNVQSVSIGPASLLPSIDHHIAFKKVDWLISFQNQHHEIDEFITAIMRIRPNLPLSQTEDAIQGYQSHFVAVEAKSPDGSLYSSMVQLATWMAAGLEKTTQLQQLAGTACQPARQKCGTLPILGISVVGHTWYLFVATKVEDGNVTLYGPMGMGDTLTSKGVLELSSVLQEMKAWGLSVYWPWLRDTILKPLAKPPTEEAPLY